VATASAEYELARAIGMNQWIAAAVPGALDAYAVRALRSHREVLTAVLAMVGVNAASHLVTAGVLHVDWILITAVSAIAPLVLWRVHALSTPGEVRERALWGTDPLGEHAAEAIAVTENVPVPPAPAFPAFVPEVFELRERSPEPEYTGNVLPFPRRDRPRRTPVNSEVVRDRFLSYVLAPSSENGCMEWSGHRNADGYGIASYDSGQVRAHRAAYELWEGAIPEGLVLDHLCRNPGCVRPDHLEPVTTAENIRRGVRDRRNGAPSQVSRKTRVESTAPVITGNAPENVLAEARLLFPAGVPTVREVKSRMRVGGARAQQIIAALKNGEQT